MTQKEGAATLVGSEIMEVLVKSEEFPALQDLWNLLQKQWPFDEKNYPRWRDKPNEEMRIERLKHCLLHLNKTLGKIAEALEPYDHGGKVNEYMLQHVIVKAFIEVSRMALLDNFTAQTFSEACDEKLRKSERKANGGD